ncbi:hypothetical protein ACFE04_023741 [Oxalis oulophora]
MAVSFTNALGRNGALLTKDGDISSPMKESSNIDGSWSRQNIKRVLEPALVEILPPTESEEYNKARTNDLASAAEVVTPVFVKAPRRKLRRPAASGQFKLVASWLGDFDSSPKNGETEVSTSLVGTLVEKEAE